MGRQVDENGWDTIGDRGMEWNEWSGWEEWMGTVDGKSGWEAWMGNLGMGTGRRVGRNGWEKSGMGGMDGKSGWEEWMEWMDGLGMGMSGGGELIVHVGELIEQPRKSQKRTPPAPPAYNPPTKSVQQKRKQRVR